MNTIPTPNEMLTLKYCCLDFITVINYGIYDNHKVNFNAPNKKYKETKNIPQSRKNKYILKVFSKKGPD